MAQNREIKYPRKFGLPITKFHLQSWQLLSYNCYSLSLDSSSQHEQCALRY